MATYAELTIEQGATFTSTVTVLDNSDGAFNLTGFTSNAQIRKSYYTSAFTTVTCNVSDAANGKVSLSISAADTANLIPGRYVYDLLITNATLRLRVVEGIATVLPSVTKIT